MALLLVPLRPVGTAPAAAPSIDLRIGYRFGITVE
jgi:hypothetical protein